MSRYWLLILVLLLPGHVAAAQVAADDPGVARLVSRLENLMTSGNPEALSGLISPSIDQEMVRAFGEDFFAPDLRRGVARERDRAPLQGVPRGEGYRLVVEFLSEIANHARIMT